MKSKRILFMVILMITFMGCGIQNETKTLRLGHGLDVSHSVHKAMVKMAEDLSTRSGGKLKLEIYPSQQLGTERECLELLQIGSLDMTKVSVGVLENFAPKMKVLGLPFLFRDRQHSFDVLDGPIGEMLLNEGEKYWLKGLGYYDAGSRSFYTMNKPIEKPDDLIPKDTMSLLLQEMMISTSAKFIKNKNNQKNINYMPFVYDRFKIDSTRFESSNYYYMSTIDLYQEILEKAKASINTQQDVLKKVQKELDSIKKDALKLTRSKLKELDSLKVTKNFEKLELSKRTLEEMNERQ